MNYTDEQIKQAIALTSEETQDMLFSSTVENAVRKIGTNASLNENQVVVLNGIVNFVIMGLAKRKEAYKEIAENLRISEELAKDLASKIDWQILTPILGASKITQTPPQTPKEVKAIALEPQETTPSSSATFESHTSEIPTLSKSPKPSTPTQRESATTTNLNPELAPENLPTEEKIIKQAPQATNNKPEVINNEALDSFEEKMKRVFTEASELPTDEPTTTSSTTKKHDLYREPIE